MRFLLWVGRYQVRLLAGGIVFGIAWMVAQAFMPYALGRAIEDGIVERDGTALGLWAALLLGLGVVQAFTGILRHRFAVANWLAASFRMIQVVAHHVARVGPAVRGRVTTGEVVATCPTTRCAPAGRSTSRRGSRARSCRTS